MGVCESLDELAGDSDDDLAWTEAGHLLGFLEGDRAVVHHGRDVGDRPGLHVRQALALPPDAADDPLPRLVDLEDERLRELGPDVEGGAGGERFLALTTPQPAKEGHPVRYRAASPAAAPRAT